LIGKQLQKRRTKDSLEQAITCFETSLKCDISNGDALVEMVECYLSLHFSDYLARDVAQAKMGPLLASIEKAQLRSESVHLLLGEYSMKFEWNLECAKHHFQAALSLNPSSIVGHYRYSDFLSITGHAEEAVSSIRNLLFIDPASVETYRHLGKLFWKLRRYELSCSYLNDAIILDPNDYISLTLLAANHYSRGDLGLAQTIFTRSLEIHYNPETLAMIGLIDAKSGRPLEAKKVIDTLGNDPNQFSNHSLKIARIWMELGNRERAAEYFWRSIDEHEPDLLSVLADQRFDPFVDEEPYLFMINKLGLESVKRI
jgi:tetratricopeptide (TPR) repeat protein